MSKSLESKDIVEKIHTTIIKARETVIQELCRTVMP